MAVEHRFHFFQFEHIFLTKVASKFSEDTILIESSMQLDSGVIAFNDVLAFIIEIVNALVACLLGQEVGLSEASLVEIARIKLLNYGSTRLLVILPRLLKLLRVTHIPLDVVVK